MKYLILFNLLAMLWSMSDLSASFELINTSPNGLNILKYSLNRGANPMKALRRMCAENFIRGDDCRQYQRAIIGELGTNDSRLCGYNDDTIIQITDCSDVSYTWGHVKLHIDMHQLHSRELCSEMLLAPFTTNVDSSIEKFCAIHNFSGRQCRELSLEVHTYLINLYDQPTGPTLENAFRLMYLEEDLNYVQVPIDVIAPWRSDVSTVFFAQYPTHFIESVTKFCLTYKLRRRDCTAFTEYINQQVTLFYGQESGEFWALLDVMRAIEKISLDRAQLELSYPPIHVVMPQGRLSVVGLPKTDYVDADFIEIGTSNFNTITQLIDESDHLIGFAIEPSVHYLRSLPDVTGVTKVNCAIVPASSAAAPAHLGVQKTVDLYSIPEQVIDALGLAPWLKGCNAVGRYHPMHAGLHEHVIIDSVTAFTLQEFLQRHRIRKIRLLKIDAEGYDVVILEELYQYIVAQADQTLYPERIVFESNEIAQKPIVEELIEKFRQLGYHPVLLGEDTILARIV